MPHEDHSSPSHIEADGDLDATQICVLRNAREEIEALPIEAEVNLSPDYLSNARENISAEAGFQLVVATGHCYITRPGISTSGRAQLNHPDPNLRNVSSANFLFGAGKTLSISQVQDEHGIDVCVPSSSSSGPDEHTMARVTVCRNTQFERQTIKEHRERDSYRSHGGMGNRQTPRLQLGTTEATEVTQN